MPTGFRHRIEDKCPQFVGQLLELFAVQRFKVGGRMDRIEQVQENIRLVIALHNVVGQLPQAIRFSAKSGQGLQGIFA